MENIDPSQILLYGYTCGEVRNVLARASLSIRHLDAAFADLSGDRHTRGPGAANVTS